MSNLTSLAALLAVGIQAAPGPPADRQVQEIGVEAEIVQLDVVVTDGNDQPVTDLGADDFELTEDGRPQLISHFAPAVLTRVRPTNEGTPGAAAHPEGGERARHLVLAVDDYHLKHEELTLVKAALSRFIDGRLGPQDQVVVAAASGSLGPLQQFTTDRDVLRRAVARLQIRDRTYRAPVDVPRMSDYQAELIESGDKEALDLAMMEIINGNPARRTGTKKVALPDMAETRARALARQIVSTNHQAAQLTLSSLERLVRGLQPLRGRRVVVLFSSGFYLGPERQSSRTDLEVLADAAARSGVVVYTIDARGLIATPAFGDAKVGRDYDIVSYPGVRERIELRGMEAARDSLSALALDTGGLPLFNRNDLGASLVRVVEDSAAAYRLAFEPRDSPRDGHFHRIEVRVRGRSGLRVRTASGYYARAAALAATSKAAARPGDDTSELVRAALDAPYALRSIPVDLTAEYLSTTASEHIVVNASIDPAGLPFEAAADGHDTTAFDLVGVVIDEEGKTVSQFAERVDLRLTAEAKDRAFRNGLTYQKTLVVRPGLLQARIAVASSSGRLGSASHWVEVPDRKRRGVALSSVLLIGEGEGSAPAAPSARGTLTFDRPRRTEVSRRFPRGGPLDYLLFVYGGKAGPPVPADLVVERQLLSGSSVLTRSAPGPVTPDGPDGLPTVTGRLRLDALAPGDYELRLMVSDRRARSEATRSLRFTVE